MMVTSDLTLSMNLKDISKSRSFFQIRNLHFLSRIWEERKISHSDMTNQLENFNVKDISRSKIEKVTVWHGIEDISRKMGKIKRQNIFRATQ